jgi:hypothetical protein
MKWLLPVVVLAAVCSTSAHGQGSAAAPDTEAASGDHPVRVEVVLPQDEITLGQRFEVLVRAQGPAGTVFSFPVEPGDDKVQLKALTGGTPPTDGVQRYSATVFVYGTARLPPVTVSYRLPSGRTGETSTEETVIHIASLLSAKENERVPIDIRGPISVMPGVLATVALAVLALGATVAAFVLIRRGRRAFAPVVPEVPPVEPDVQALTALNRLHDSGLLDAGKVREFYIALTEIAKRYLERRLEAPVLEMTSAETVAFLRDHPLCGEHITLMRELMGAADLVKFACDSGEQIAAERQLDAVRQLVKRVEERLRPAAPSPAPNGQEIRR